MTRHARTQARRCSPSTAKATAKVPSSTTPMPPFPKGAHKAFTSPSFEPSFCRCRSSPLLEKRINFRLLKESMLERRATKRKKKPQKQEKLLQTVCQSNKCSRWCVVFQSCQEFSWLTLPAQNSPVEQKRVGLRHRGGDRLLVPRPGHRPLSPVFPPSFQGSCKRTLELFLEASLHAQKRTGFCSVHISGDLQKALGLFKCWMFWSTLEDKKPASPLGK